MLTAGIGPLLVLGFISKEKATIQQLAFSG